MGVLGSPPPTKNSKAEIFLGNETEGDYALNM